MSCCGCIVSVVLWCNVVCVVCIVRCGVCGMWGGLLRTSSTRCSNFSAENATPGPSYSSVATYLTCIRHEKVTDSASIIAMCVCVMCVCRYVCVSVRGCRGVTYARLLLPLRFSMTKSLPLQTLSQRLLMGDVYCIYSVGTPGR
jgi:hypothetical protein